MARIAKKPINLLPSIKLRQEGNVLYAEGPKGKLSLTVPEGIKITITDKSLLVEIIPDSLNSRELNIRHGLSHALIQNMVQGVSAGFEKKLEIRGVGYRATFEKGKLTMSLGFSHPIVLDMPAGIVVDVEKQTLLTVKGIDKYLVGEMAAKIRKIKPPEVYKGTGIRYLNEFVRQKVGKTAATKGAGAK
jgi:large subunit ribosomal protein L6